MRLARDGEIWVFSVRVDLDEYHYMPARCENGRFVRVVDGVTMLDVTIETARMMSYCRLAGPLNWSLGVDW